MTKVINKILQLKILNKILDKKIIKIILKISLDQLNHVYMTIKLLIKLLTTTVQKM
jgi:hypothetical protein